MGRELADRAVELVSSGLAARADPEKAGPMAAYMKTETPFYGVKKPERAPVLKELNQRCKPADRADYELVIRALWALPHREEKYLALAYADKHKAFHRPASMPLFEQLIREGRWWDLVDVVATNLVGGAFRADRAAVQPTIERWNDDKDLWIRRASILSQNRHREETDEALLFRLCLARAHEKGFFIRKAIGWALRDYSRTAPDAVRDFLLAHRSELSGLSLREGARRLKREARRPG